MILRVNIRGRALEQRSGPSLILASAGSRARSGALWAESLAAAGIPLLVDEFGGECSQDEIDSGVSAARAAGAEARTANQVGGLTTITAKALARLCYDTLIADGLEAANACDANAVTPALERIVEANTLRSGLGFESGGLAIAHSVHNGLTTAGPTHAYLHGEKVAFGLIVQLVVEGQPSDDIDTVIRFCRSVGLPTTLAGVGLIDADDETIRIIAEHTVAEGETAHNEPFAVSARMVADGIRAADTRSRTLG